LFSLVCQIEDEEKQDLKAHMKDKKKEVKRGPRNYRKLKPRSPRNRLVDDRSLQEEIERMPLVVVLVLRESSEVGVEGYEGVGGSEAGEEGERRGG